MILLNAQTSSPLILSYCSCGLFETREPWIHRRRIIDSYEILYVRSGEIFMQENGLPLQAKKGDILLLRPGRQHEGTRTSTGHTSFYWAHFRLGADASDTGERLEALEPELLCFLRTAEHTRLHLLMQQLVHISNTPGYPPESCDALCLMLIQELGWLQRQERQPHRRLVGEIAEYIRVHSDEPLSALEVARQFGYHRDYLSTLMKQQLGVTLKEYISAQRIRQAQELLSVTAYSVKEISARLGFQNENQFVHFFRYHTACSPTAYRNVYFNTHFNKW